MTFLPIIERELRVRSRNRATWWIRFGAGLTGALICLPQLAYSQPYMSAEMVGRGVFSGLVIMASLLCLGSCLLTAESVGHERREGTLGLLLLTHVKTLDVLVGKLGSVGIVGFCALLAFVPMLMIPVLAGGVTGGEAARKALALVNILLFALTSGLYASSTQPDRFKAARRAMFIVLTFAFVPCVAKWVQTWSVSPSFVQPVSLLSPVLMLVAAGDTAYKSSPNLYWSSMLVVAVISGFLLFRAGVRLRRGLRAESDGARETVNTMSSGVAKTRSLSAWRAVQNRMAPAEWLVRRQRGLSAILWFAGVIGFFYYGVFGVFFRFMGSSIFMSQVSVSLACAAIQGSLVAWAASRFFVEARRSAELELLLTTPLDAGSMVSDQWRVLRRLLIGPVALMVVPMLLQGLLMMGNYRRSGFGEWMPVYYLFGAVNLLFKFAAVCWLGMWFGLRAAGQARAVLYTIGLAIVVPYVFQSAFSAVSRMLIGPAMSGFWIVVWFVPLVIDLFFYLWLIRFARRLLDLNFCAGGTDAIRCAHS